MHEARALVVQAEQGEALRGGVPLRRAVARLALPQHREGWRRAVMQQVASNTAIGNEAWIGDDQRASDPAPTMRAASVRRSHSATMASLCVTVTTMPPKFSTRLSAATTAASSSAHTCIGTSTAPALGEMGVQRGGRAQGSPPAAYGR
jgi:hypothetical protein